MAQKFGKTKTDREIMQKQIIILAAGKGSRMKSDLPKVMHKVGGKPMLEMVISNAAAVTDDLVLVYSDHIKEYLPLFSDKCKLAYQEEQLGTAHAVGAAKPLIRDDIPVAVLYGDNPLITPDIINELFDHLDSSKAAIDALVFEHEHPNAYGRIILDEQGNFKKIVEFKYATPSQREIKLCNSGIMAFAPGTLSKYLHYCLAPSHIAGQELYLTEIIQIAGKYGEKVAYYTSENHQLVVGINTQEELKAANDILAEKISPK